MRLSKIAKFKLLVVLLGLTGFATVLLTDNRLVSRVYANPEGAPAGVAGAPGEQTCTNCHSGGTGAGQLTITAPTTYTPNQTYQITVRHTTGDTSRLRWGYELTVLTAGNVKAGNLALVSTTSRLLTGGPGGARQYATHTTAGTFAGTQAPATWVVNWTAPATNVGNITFYAAGEQCNNNGNETGDQIYTATAVSLPAGSADFSLGAAPASQTAQAGTNTTYNVTVTPVSGFTGTVSFSVTGLPTGAAPSFAPSTVAGSGNTTLTVATTTDTAPGTYPLTITGTSGTLSHTANASLTITAAPPTLAFSVANYNVFEGDSSPSGPGSATITVLRTGSTADAVTVDYSSSDGTALQRTDYTTAGGTLSLAAGETGKTFTVIITDDKYAEPGETLNLALSNPTGGAVLGALSTATLTINDNDIGTPTTNPIDDTRFFVQQHYSDFLNRVPDSAGWDFWTGVITNCGSDMACVNRQRIGVSAAYYVELEFQETGSVIYRLYRAAFGTRAAPDQSRVKLDYPDFTRDRAQLVGGMQLPQSTMDFANRFVTRPAFLAEYPAAQTNAQYVNHLFDKANLTPFTSERQTEIDGMNNNGRTRAQVLLNVINLQAFKDREYNPAFVLMQYFGYLRRDPDQGGYDFWLSVLNQTPANTRGMVCAFITATEYQERFSSISTRNNSSCNGNP